MAKFLHSFPEIPIRLIIWNHVSGCNYPEIPYSFANIPNKTIFTSYYSFDNPYWTNEERKLISNKASVIYGLGNFVTTKKVINKDRYHKIKDEFVIGYIGTLDYSKLNSKFVEYCYEVIKVIPNVKFIIVGDDNNKEKIVRDAEKLGIESYLEFTGYVENISLELERFDVFGYILNSYHFGTTENVLLEAMSFGIPIVALNQCTEKYIIKHMYTGLLANNPVHYAKLMLYLYKNPKEGCRLVENAKIYLDKEFSIENNVNKFQLVYNEVLKYSKKIFKFKDIFGEKPYEWFLSCLGEDKQIFKESLYTKDKNRKIELENQIINCKDILRENTKSSIFHFEKFFPEDTNLVYWSNLVRKNEYK